MPLTTLQESLVLKKKTANILQITTPTCPDGVDVIVIEGVRCEVVCRSAVVDFITSGPGRGPTVTAAVGLVGARVVITINKYNDYVKVKCLIMF